MELSSYKPGMIFNFNNFYQFFIRRNVFNAVSAGKYVLMHVSNWENTLPGTWIIARDVASVQRNVQKRQLKWLMNG